MVIAKLMLAGVLFFATVSNMKLSAQNNMSLAPPDKNVTSETVTIRHQKSDAQLEKDIRTYKMQLERNRNKPGFNEASVKQRLARCEEELKARRKEVKKQQN